MLLEVKLEKGGFRAIGKRTNEAGPLPPALEPLVPVEIGVVTEGFAAIASVLPLL